jgi:hypothetical protein
MIFNEQELGCAEKKAVMPKEQDLIFAERKKEVHNEQELFYAERKELYLVKIYWFLQS